MKKPNKLKITIIGAGSLSFFPCTLGDILLSEKLNDIPLEVCLMDISSEALRASEKYAREAIKAMSRNLEISATTNLEAALDKADFVITAIELDRYHYWAMDFHIPRRYGFRQIYGENGGPGGMFHTLRNIGPMVEIARTMEKICPDAWLINYSNPESKLVEAVTRLTGIKTVGLCHGIGMGLNQLAELLEMPEEELETSACGLNHFGWFQTIRNKRTGEDLYPLLKEKELKARWLSQWDEIALSRMMLRTYGLWPYPGANHIGEYISWSDDFLAGTKLQYFYNPAEGDPWKTGKIPAFVYNINGNVTAAPLFEKEKNEGYKIEQRLVFNDKDIEESGEEAIPIIEAIAFDSPAEIGAVNMPNRGNIPGLPDELVVELPAVADGLGIHPKKMEPLPEAITSMIRTQGAIHKLVIEAYVEHSRNKLLQAVLLDPTISTYANAVAMINEMCELQKGILPPLHW